jgi:ABC-type transporter Mla MlaB component
MTTLHYEARAHRLRVEGDCHAADLATVHEALDTFTKLASGHLIVDLTAVTAIDPSIAAGLVLAARRARSAGGTVVLLRKHGTCVDEALTAADREASSQK